MVRCMLGFVLVFVLGLDVALLGIIPSPALGAVGFVFCVQIDSHPVHRSSSSGTAEESLRPFPPDRFPPHPNLLINPCPSPFSTCLLPNPLHLDPPLRWVLLREGEQLPSPQLQPQRRGSGAFSGPGGTALGDEDSIPGSPTSARSVGASLDELLLSSPAHAPSAPALQAYGSGGSLRLGEVAASVASSSARGTHARMGYQPTATAAGFERLRAALKQVGRVVQDGGLSVALGFL